MSSDKGDVPRLVGVGQCYLDAVLMGIPPKDDEKKVSLKSAIGIGGNAYVACHMVGKLGHPVEVITNYGDDLGAIFEYKAAKYGVTLHNRRVENSAFSSVNPHEGQRAIFRSVRDTRYLDPFPKLDVTRFKAAHFDGHMLDAATWTAKECHANGILTSLDGGAYRDGDILELFCYIHVAVMSLDLCKAMQKSPRRMLTYVRETFGCQVAGVTLGEYGLLFYVGDGDIEHLPALMVPSAAVVDTNGCGDFFHGGYLDSYLTNPELTWVEHFKRGRAAAAYKAQHLGSEAALPTRDKILMTMKLPESDLRPNDE